LSAFLAATVALVALYPLSRWKRYGEPAEGITERHAMRDDRSNEPEERDAPMGLAMSLLPYIVLTAIAVGVLTIGPLDDLLSRLSLGMSFPAVETGYGVVNEAADPYSPFE